MALTEVAARRARMYAGGSTVQEIARAEGVTATAVRPHLNRTVYFASRVARGDELPDGLVWKESAGRPGERPYRFAAPVRGYGTRVPPRDWVVWAFAVLDAYTPATDPRHCPTCGRPL